ncbi:hypothetical protein ASC64_16890 [Nocardioides sp. Root122]|uniref:ROK family protein n=1 Tax=Nocardioides TaxID=1839 RepID=UPI000702B8BF|nr:MULTISPECIES: ROK family protein [Nocardioides]KQV63285.1 hypothetical protein ASC64_16890 [Nocardioides sp. Root122]MCK9824337.1 ROK family protein [Nocardioides cavernae]
MSAEPRRRTGVVDVGGTTMRRSVLEVGPDGEPVLGEVVTEPAAVEPAGAVEQVLAMAEVASRGVDALGVVLPGIVDDASGTGTWSENLGWRDVPFRALVQERVRVPVEVGHDVRAWGAAERRWGAARGLSDVAVVVVGTGIAAALVVDGRPLVAHGLAGEIGHLRVAGDEPCACGGTGCLEAVASAAGIVRQYNAVADAPVRGAIDVADAVRRREPLATEVWHTALDRLSDGLAAMATVVAPEAIVLGGGLARAGEDLFLAPLRSRLAARLRYTPVPDLRAARFAGTGGLIGAACLAARTTEE